MSWRSRLTLLALAHVAAFAAACAVTHAIGTAIWNRRHPS